MAIAINKPNYYKLYDILIVNSEISKIGGYPFIQ